MTKGTSSFTLGTTVMVLLALPVVVQASEAADDRIPIVDPELLESRGFAPDATNVYATPEAYAQMLMNPAERAAATELEAEQMVDPEAEPASAFGTDTNGVATIHATEFHPVRVTGTTSYGSAGVTERWCDAGLTNTYMGIFHGLPHGARARLRRIWYYDNSDENITADLVRMCIPVDSASDPEFTILRTNTSSGTPGYRRFGPGNFLLEDIDSKSCVYAVRVNLGDGNSCAGNQLRILKANLSWRRQVSPAPDTATFDDVPPGHLFFQHIEALAGSGITSGCDADSFCPNAPLTRGQMAAFLATALGLNWDAPFWEP